VEFADLFRNSPKLFQLPKKGKGETILVLPGYGTNDSIMKPLRMYLQYLGYNAIGWKLGNNDGNVPVLLERVKLRIQEEFQKTGKKILVLGWSLGGYIGREAARENQDKVSKVIALGSPVVGGPKYTAIGDLYSQKFEIQLDELEREIDERFQIPLEIPVVSIYSKKDNIVSWNSSIDHYSPNATNHEVESTHLGLIGNYEVYRLLAWELGLIALLKFL
jgi:pimeloyl-ACP methyl ester carboxylesterase